MREQTVPLDATTEEQPTLDAAYARRAALLEQVSADLAQPPRDRVEEMRAQRLRRRRAELQHAENGLIFGRLDGQDGSTRHIGRVGLPSEDEDAEPLVLDWRADAARPFYTATPVDPQGQRRRRHIRTSGTLVAGVDDEPLEATSGDQELVGEGALLAALDERRTGRMGTAVATLQREQDDIVRADARGPLVVQGGPGTGKTVVALHRVAYLLFSHPDLARQGVLVLGPSPRFLDYIAQVLPALGETSVVSRTCDTLVPGVEVSRAETREAAEIKGRPMWQPALEAYVAGLAPLPTDLALLLDGERYVLPRRVVGRALESARTGRTHLAARSAFIERAQDLLTDAVIERQEELVASMEEGFEDVLAGVDRSLARADDRTVHSGASGSDVDGALSEADIERLREHIASDVGVAAALDAYWPTLEARPTLHDLLGDEDLLHRWVPQLSASERALVAAEPAELASSDVALLDAMADLIGSSERREQGEFLADRAAADRDWTYGHVVVDEAQELSAMEWHMVLRRSPRRSVTAVGDIDQTESPHSHTSWDGAVSPVFGSRWRRGELTICYRTPREVMGLTGPVLRNAGSLNEPPRAVRSSGIEPWRVVVNDDELAARAAALTMELRARWTGGSVGVVAPEHRLGPLRAACGDVPVLSASQAKGLEWDASLVVDPDGIAAEPRGWNGLYVALTRCTQELGQVAPGNGRIREED